MAHHSLTLLLTLLLLLLPAAVPTGVPHAGLADLPPLLEFANGTAVRTAADFAARQAEIGQLLLSSYYGSLPSQPPQLSHATTLNSTHTRGHTDATFMLHFTSPSLQFTVETLIPDHCSATAPCPLFMTQGNHRRWALAGLARGYIVLIYPGADSLDQTDVFRAAFPEATWGLIARRAYLGMRALDYALTLPQVNSSAVTLTGHSRNGKQSLIFAAFDKRITAVIDSSSGAPAISAYRFTSAYTSSESPYGPWPAPPSGCNCSCPRDTNDPRPKDPRCCWWPPSILNYEGRENMNPIDSHGLLAMIAPRIVASQAAYTEDCNPSFAVERTHMAAKPVFEFLNVPQHRKLIWRPGEHHGYDNIQLYFDFFDATLGRSRAGLDAFPEVLLHTFDWAAWNHSHAFVPPPSKATAPAVERIQYGLGVPPPLGWSPGGAYGEIDEDSIPVMLHEGTGMLQTNGNVTRMGINFGKYVHGMLYYPAGADRRPSDAPPLPAVVWLHPYSYQSGYVENYRRDSVDAFSKLAKAGYVVLAFDQVGFGQRLLEKANFYNRTSNQDWSLLGEMVQDAQSAIDALASPHNGSFPDGMPVNQIYNGLWYPTVDPKRIYVAGYAMGGMVALYAAALDQRFAGAASLSGISPLRNNSLDLWTGDHSMLYEWHALQPRLGWYQDSTMLAEQWPYDYDDLLKAISPRPSLVTYQTADRICNVPALQDLLAGVEGLPGLTVNTLPGENVMDDALSDTLVHWLSKVAAKKA